MKLNGYAKTTLKIIAWVAGCIFGLLLLIMIALNLSPVQQYLAQKGVSYLSEKLHTTVKLKRLRIIFPRSLALEDLYIADQNQDTLLYGQHLLVNIDMLQLLTGKIAMNRIELENFTAHVDRLLPDTAFNFNFILDAFAGDTAQNNPPDTASSISVSLGLVSLKNIYCTYRDQVTGMDATLRLGAFATYIKKSDLDNMDFGIQQTMLSDVQAHVIQTKPLLSQTVSTDTAANSYPNLSLGKIALKNIRALYNDSVSGIRSEIQLANLQLDPEKTDLPHQRIDLASLAMNGLKGAVTLYPSPYQDTTLQIKDTISTTDSETGWTINLKNLSLQDNHFIFDNNLEQPVHQGMDYNHLDVQQLNLSVSDLHYDPDSSAAGIKEFSFFEKNSGFRLKQLHTDLLYSNTNANLDNLLVETGESVLRKKINITYDSIGMFSTDPGKAGIHLDLDNCSIGMKDVLCFVPDLATNEYFKKLSNATIQLQGKTSGTLNNLQIPQLKISVGGATHLYGSAHLKGLPDMDRAWFDVQLDELAGTRTGLTALLPDSLLSGLRIPDHFLLKGNYKGSLTNFFTRALLKSSYGDASLEAKMSGHKGNEKYQGVVSLQQFNIGKLLRQDSLLGAVTLQLQLQGAGLDAKTAAVRLKGRLEEAYVHGYNYHDLQLQSTYDHQEWEAAATMNDPNIRFDLNTTGDLSGKYPAVKLQMRLDSINLQALKFSDTAIRIRGKIEADLPQADIDHLNGTINLTGFQLAKGAQLFLLDTMRLQAKATDSFNRLDLQSEFASASVYGKYKLSSLGDVITSRIKRYFDTAYVPADSIQQDSAQHIAFNIKFYHPPVLKNLLPDLSAFAESSLRGHIDTRDDSLTLYGIFPKTIYQGYEIDSLRLMAVGDHKSLKYHLALDQLKSASFQLFQTSLYGNLARQILSVNLRVRDAKSKDKYRLSGVLKTLANGYEFKLQPDSLQLDYERWSVPADNALQYGKDGILVNHLKLQNKDQSLQIQSTEARPNAPLEVSFEHFQIETLTNMAEQDTLLLGGEINGNVLLDSLLQNPVFTSDLKINHFNFKNDTIGNILVKVDNKTANAYNAQIGIEGNGNDLSLNGLYYTQPESRFDLNMDIRHLQMSTVEAFSFGQITKGAGEINGRLDMQGTIDAPKIKGDLHFDKAMMNVTYLNSLYKLPDETIRFDDQGIRFNKFTILDSLNQKAMINGYVYTTDYRFYKFALDVNARNFRALNTRQSDNDLYYGPVYIDAGIHLRGDMNVPKIDMNLRLREKSVFTVVVPGSDPSIEERDGVIEFIDAEHIEDTARLSTIKDSIRHSEFKGLQLSANIEVDTAAELDVIVDQQNGDNLKVKGNANLNATIDASGKISLTGRYELLSGAYLLSFNGLIKRRFDIKKGSSITWTGDPTSANVDITAIYNIETSAEELISDQVTDAANNTIYKQKLPFEVNLIMKGELLEPDISFAIDMPESGRNAFNGSVYTRLKQINQVPSDLNKQVMGLLVLNHFIAENPFNSLSSGGGGAEAMVRESASKILSQQLNALAASLIKGVDLNFDLQSEEDYSTGKQENRTDLNVGLSKQLFNDRTTVYVGSNVELEGPQTPGRKASNIAGDVSVEYKLTRDGRYRIRAYRKDEYQGVIEGQVVETGASFILVMDYDHFKELFQKTRKERRLQNRERRQHENQ